MNTTTTTTTTARPNRSQSDAMAAIERANATPQPHPVELKMALVATKNYLDSYSRNVTLYGSHWASSRLRRHTLLLNTALANGCY